MVCWIADIPKRYKQRGEPRRYKSIYEWVRSKIGYGLSAACEYGAEEQTVDHIVLECPIHRPPHGLNGPTVLDNETTEWLLNTCPEI